jgi:putative ABC transport system substrate-binding protein
VAKQVELLNDIVPKGPLGMIVNPAAPTSVPSAADTGAAAQALGRDLAVSEAATEAALDPAFVALVGRGVRGLILSVDPVFDSRPELLGRLAARPRLPTLFYIRAFVEAGGLVSYGASLTDTYRQAGLYAGRILAGARPGELPVMQPARFELVINLKTARSLGLVLPPTLVARADEVID